MAAKSPSQARTHEENRSWVCLACWCKIKEKSGQRKVPECKYVNDDTQLQKKFAKHMYADYYKNKDFLPVVVCNNCRLIITSQGTESERKIEELIDYDQFVEQVKQTPRRLRKDYKCGPECPICNIASFHHRLTSADAGFKVPEKGKKKKKPGRPKQSSPKQAPAGFFDSFNKAEKYEFLINNLTPYSKEHIAASVIDQKSKELKGKKKPGVR